MRSGGCWSSVVATVQERAALRLTPAHDWLVACVLPAGHNGAHASDGAQEHTGRRRWLLWGDYARGAQNLADEFECSAQALDGAPCLLFAGHGGHHRFAAPLGEDFPAESSPVPRPSVADRGRHETQAPPFDGHGRHGAAVPSAPESVPPVPPPWMPTRYSGPGTPPPRSLQRESAQRESGQQGSHRQGFFQAPPLPPEDESTSLASLDALFAGMPSLKDLPHTELLAFPDESFRSVAPSWPDSRGEYVAEHHLAHLVDPEVVVSGPNRFESAAVSDDQIIDVEEVPDPSLDGRRAGRRSRTEATTWSGRHGRDHEPEADRVEADAGDVRPESRWVHVRPGEASVLTTPMVEVISSNDDPVRMGVPTARRRLAVDDGEIESVTAAVADAAERLRVLPDTDGEVSAALQDVGQALARLSEILRSR